MPPHKSSELASSKRPSGGSCRNPCSGVVFSGLPLLSGRPRSWPRLQADAAGVLLHWGHGSLRVSAIRPRGPSAICALWQWTRARIPAGAHGGGATCC
eukprot:9720394-Lingulodinium_polyedra.AAC.1